MVNVKKRSELNKDKQLEIIKDEEKEQQVKTVSYTHLRAHET